MAKKKDLTGQVFGRLTVTGIVVESRGSKNLRWHADCECGGSTTVTTCSLSSGKTRSCGCLHADTMTQVKTTHGHTRGGPSPTYSVWASMLKRCRNPKALNYERYGARGIRVCDRWLDFGCFLIDMGERPSSKHQIDRIDNSGNYEPENCHWVLPVVNYNNRRSARIIDTPNGRMSLREAGDFSGIPAATIRNRVEAGWPTDSLFSAVRRRPKKLT